MANEPTDPIDTYDSQHGKQGDGIPKLSDAEAWGTAQNPVRETPPAASNLKDVGR